LDVVLKVRSTVNSGEKLGAELFTCGPLFTAQGGHGTEYFKDMPPNIREQAQAQFTRIPASIDEARRQVDELKRSNVDCIKAILEAGGGASVFNRLDSSIFQAVAQESHAQGLPLAVHTGDVRDVTDAVSADANSIEHGSFREAIPDTLFQQMAGKKIFYDPTLSVAEAFRDFAAGDTALLKRSLVQQVGPTDLIEGTEKAMASKELDPVRQRIAQFPINLEVGTQNLQRAYKDGVPLVTGSDAGNFLILHGPTVQHELVLWVRAGIAPAVALEAATYNAARLLRVENRIGSIRAGNDADLLLVDGNPLEDISAVERISIVFFKGEQLDRSDLFNQE
jgi:imidazolonepropionase-like amidohydrolase